MRITLAEREILKAIADIHPKPSSIKKLTTATGKATNEVAELVSGLKLLQLVNDTAKKEVYLLKDGKVEMGVYEPSAVAQPKVVLGSPANSAPAFVTQAEKESLSESLNRQQSGSKVTVIEPTPTIKKPSVFEQLEQLEQKLTAPTIVVESLALKSAVLLQLSKILAPDISEVLLEVNEDLLRVGGESLPESAA